MVIDPLFSAAFQASLILGLVHGINPCGHSWLVLAPFVVGEKQGRQVAMLTVAFLLGTALACLLLGLTLGALSTMIPSSMLLLVEVGTSAILILFGIILIVRPGLIHIHHGHDHGHDHAREVEQIHDLEKPHGYRHHHHHGHHHHGHRRRLTGMALFGIGFGNMIVPCPTVALMYKYALDSASPLKATLVFAVYALGTALAVSAAIYAIFHAARLLEKLARDSVETALMRGAGVVTILFAGYSLYGTLS